MNEFREMDYVILLREASNEPVPDDERDDQGGRMWMAGREAIFVGTAKRPFLVERIVIPRFVAQAITVVGLQIGELIFGGASERPMRICGSVFQEDSLANVLEPPVILWPKSRIVIRAINESLSNFCERQLQMTVIGKSMAKGCIKPEAAR